MTNELVLLFENFSSEAEYNNAVLSATAALPSGMSATPGEQTRDSNGKVVSARIGLPGNATAANRTAARDAVVNNNPGVSQASEFPKVVDENFDSLTPGADVATSVGETIALAGSSTFNATLTTSGTRASKIIAASNAESVGGAGSALQFEKIDNTSITIIAGGFSYGHESGIEYLASNNGFTAIKSLKVKGSIKLSADGVDGDLANRAHFEIDTRSTGGYVLQIRRDGGSDVWTWEISGGGDFAGAVTAVDRLSYITFEYTLLSTGIATLDINGSPVGSITGGFGPGLMSSLEIFGRVNFDDTNSNIVSKDVILDDLEVTILEGVL